MDINQITELVRRAIEKNDNEEKTTGNIAGESDEKRESYGVSKDFLGISLEEARNLCEAVRRKAEEIGVKSVCAVVNAGARPVLTECSDGAFIASYDIALNKAFTSVSLKMKTSKLCTLAQPGGPLYGIQNTNDGKIVIFGGGVPLIRDGAIVGGFGVSGGTAEKDTFLGDYAEEVFNNVR